MKFLERTLTQYDCVLIKGKFGQKKDTHTGEQHVKMKARGGVMLLEAREHWLLPVNHQRFTGRGTEQFFPHEPSEEANPATI